MTAAQSAKIAGYPISFVNTAYPNEAAAMNALNQGKIYGAYITGTSSDTLLVVEAKSFFAYTEIAPLFAKTAAKLGRPLHVSVVKPLPAGKDPVGAVVGSLLTATIVSGRATTPSDRLLATVVFEDVVGSTKLVSEIGDDAWGRLRVQRERLVRDCVEEHGGRVISTAGDGSMCTLPGPAVAIRCAEQLHEVVRPLELELRVGIHTGECERIGNELSGLAVHVAARIGAAASPGETLVSRAVSDLAAGSGLNFASRG